MASELKQYLGDGVYADFDGYQLVLTTWDGIHAVNTIYLDDQTYAALLRYVERLKQQAERNADAPPAV